MNLRLNLQARVEVDGREPQLITITHELLASETALLICDMWDNHWCRSAARRCDDIAQRMAPVVDAAREQGVFIIHAPSDTMEFYADTPQRRRMQEAPTVAPPPSREIFDPGLPIDDSDGGCDDEPADPVYKAWTRQHPAIRIAEEDGITDRGAEVYNVLQQRGIRRLLIMGVHTNMCVLNRTFAIRQMTKWSVPCILVRDLTDTMYNPRMRPFVPHNEGTALVIHYIERYLCFSTTTEGLIPITGEPLVTPTWPNAAKPPYWDLWDPNG